MDNTHQAPVINVSTKYDCFSISERNRDIDFKKVSRFTEESKNNPHLMAVNPILVNEKMEIIDGQHRFMACRNNNIPIYYIKDTRITYKDIITLNKDQKNWDIRDYIKYYIVSGNENYIKFDNFCRENGCSYSVAFSFLRLPLKSGVGLIKEGKLIFPKRETELRAIQMATGVNELQKLKGDSKVKFNKDGTRTFNFGYSFIEAIGALPTDINLEQFFEKLKECIEAIRHSNIISDYHNQFRFLGIL